MESDANHSQALQIAKRLVEGEAKVLFPVSALVEAATAIQRRYNNPPLANELLQQYKDPNLLVLGILQEDFIGSTDYFEPNASKHHTPFDCLILALAEAHKVDVILSFDEFYKDRGFTVAPDLLEESSSQKRNFGK